MRGAVAVLLLLLLAGCSNAPGDGTPAAPAISTSDTSTAVPDVAVDNATAVLPPTIDLLGCSNRGGVFSIPATDAAPFIPDGFTPQEGDDPSRPTVAMYAIAVQCNNAAVNGTSLEGGVRFAYAEFPVTPPAGLVVDGISDCTIPVIFVVDDQVVGDAIALYGLGQAGTGTAGDTSVGLGVGGTHMMSFDRAGGQLQFIFGEAGPDTLTVVNGPFVLYGVQQGQVVSVIHGEASGTGTAHQASAMARTMGFDLTFQDATLGFAATGFDLHFTPRTVPAAA